MAQRIFRRHQPGTGTGRAAGRLIRLAVMLAAGAAAGAAAAAELELPGARLTADSGVIEVERDGKKIISLTGIRFDYQDPVSWAIASATPEQLVIALEYPPEVEFGQRAGDRQPRTARLVVSREEQGFRVYSAPEWADQVTLDFDYLGDHFFGLSSPLQPDNRHSPDLAGAEIDVEVVNEAGNIVENYASAFSAFYLSSFGYGAFFDSFGRGRYRFAQAGRNQVHHETGTLDWHVFPGDDGPAIHRAYFGLIGAPKKVPLWALGPVAWRDQNNGGAAEILDDIARFGELRMPLTAWFVDRPYSDGAHAWSQMNFAAPFADPAAWIGRIRQEHGLEFMTWSTTGFFGETPFERHLPGGYTYADLSHPGTAAAFQARLAEQHAAGVKGHKMDRVDEHFPPWEPWFDASVTPAAARNTYAFLFARVHDEALRRTWGADQFTFARATIHRAQPWLSAVWGGDPRSNWAGLRGNLANAMRASFMGFPVWGSDVGGYLGEGYIDADLYLRWLQFGLYSGFMEIKLDGAGGTGRDRMPWRYDEAFQARYRALLERRMRLLPLLYSLANSSARNGVMMQPLAYRHLDDPGTYATWDQFYLGPGLMVAPLTGPGEQRDVYLPEGVWHRLAGDSIAATHPGRRRITVRAGLDDIPLFARANSILVTGDIYRGNARNWVAGQAPSLRIDAFPGEAGSTAGFEYVDPFDADRVRVIRLAADDSRIAVQAPALGVTATVVIHGTEAAQSREFAGDEAIDFSVPR